MTLDSELRGLEKTQRRLERLLEDTSVSGGLRAIFAKATLRAHRYASTIVHVLTGRLKNSLFPRVQARGNQIYGITGTNVVYARVEHERGPEHEFFGRTVREEGQAIVAMVESDIERAANRAGGS